MKEQIVTPKMLRQRKFLLVAPLIVLPFLTLFFWAMGGGKVNPADAKAMANKGFNMTLPDAKLGKDKAPQDKMSFYSKAALDSIKLKQQMKSDPYYHGPADSAGQRGTLPGFTGRKPAGNDPDASTHQIEQRLAQLQATMNKPAPAYTAPAYANNTPVITRQQTGSQQTAEDPELKQMNVLLEKVLDIQHPERVKEKPADNVGAPEKKFQAIPAIVDGNQKVVSGTVVKLKLLDSVTINGQLIPKGTLIYGAGSLYNQRLTITIKNIGLGNTILPVDLTVFDKNDALEGISVPDAVTGDVVKDGADNGLQSMQLMSLDQSMGAQAAAAGINTAKSLFSKKIKRVKGKIKDGHLVLLRDNKKTN